MADNNKVKFGLENVYYAMATIAADGTAEFEKPKHIPGAVNLNMDPQGDMTVFRADNMDYYVMDNNNGYQGDLEMAKFPDEFRRDVFDEYVDTNGLQVEQVSTTAKYFALLFEFKGDVNKTRHVMYKCTATRPAVASSTTPEGAVEPVTETSTIRAGQIYVADIEKNVVKAKVAQGDAKYATWFTEVTLPTAEATGN